MTDKKLMVFGNISQLWVGVGWIPHELVLAVNEAGKYIMRFNLQTYNEEDGLTLVPCIIDGADAKTFYEEFMKKDSIVIWGNLHHTYRDVATATGRIYCQVKVLAYTILTDFVSGLNDADLSPEKQKFLREMSNLFDENAPAPTEEEIKQWRLHWREWNDRNRRKA